MIKLNCIENGDYHSFSPRYDVIERFDQEALDKGIKFYNENGTSPFIDAKIKKKEYLFDICTCCGIKINRT